MITLWDGLPYHPDGRNIKAALLGISGNMPAMKKVTQFLGHKADYGCSRCLFQAEREESSRGASGNMSYLTFSMAPPRNRLHSVLSINKLNPNQKLLIYKRKMVFVTSDFDIIRMSKTDPMHTILLGLVHNEEKLCLSSPMMSQFYSHIQRVKVPYDIGHIPSNINGKTDLTSLTADQWKNLCTALFIWTNAYKSICFLCEIVKLNCQANI